MRTGPAALACCLLAVLAALPAAGQEPGASPEPASNPAGLRWWQESALVVGGVVLLITVDVDTRNSVRGNLNHNWENFAAVARTFGEPVVWAPVGAGLFLAGLAGRSERLQMAGARTCASLAVAALLSGGLKGMAGRYRPGAGRGHLAAEPFSGQTSFPSGHTTMAFALATSLADEIDRTWAAIGLYLAAAATGYSRIVDDYHWLSDVAGGAALGYYSAKLVRARILPGDRPEPAVAILPTGSGLALAVTGNLP